MPYTVVEFQETPNPNAIKCVLDRAIAETPRSYFSKEQGASDPLASSLFAIEGVTNVLILGNFVTVSRAPGASWKTLKSGVERAMKAAT
ncbi:MAG: NifU N-terminal domain-containing protein [Phycisphaerales bacterium]